MDKQSLDKPKARLCAQNTGLNTRSNLRQAGAFAPQPAPCVLVVFSARTELAWLRLLRPGFRHCFALVENRGGENADGIADGTADVGGRRASWLLYNPLSNGTQLALWAGIDAADLQEGLRRQGYRVVKTHVRPIGARLYGWRPYTCVEAVKRVLGLHAPWVFTPWQLYRYLKKSDKRKIVLDYGV